MAVSTTVTMDFTGELLHARVVPRQRYSPPTLKIKCRGGDVELLLDEEHLAEIARVIQQHLDAIRYHETTDQQRIYEHEIDREIEEESASWR